jgi:Domain of unknown function (DUF4034)
MKRLLIILVCVLIIVGAGISLWPAIPKTWWTLHPRSQPVAPRQMVELPEADGSAMVLGWGSYRDPGLDQGAAQSAEVRRLFAAGNFEGLDTLADQLRKTKARYASGMWRISAFYQELEVERRAPPDVWKTQQQTLERWIVQRPQSITARVALADFLTKYAWQARGADWANKVTPEGWDLFAERLSAATKVLGDARSLETKDPHWWFVAQTVALGQGWDRATYERLFAEAIAFEPEYHHCYCSKARFLLPKWYGQPGEWEQFAMESAARPGGPGPAIYARIVDSVTGDYTDIFHESGASWEQTRAGFELLVSQYPDSGKLLVDFLRLAAVATDTQCGAQIFAKIGTRYDPRLWINGYEVMGLQSWSGYIQH